MMGGAQDTVSGLSYLLGHPAFRRSPLRVAMREVAWRVVRARGRDVTIRIHGGCRMMLTPPARKHDHAGLVFVFREFYEPAVLHAIDRHVAAGAAVYDVGANIGLWSLRMGLRTAPAGSVTSFEPVPYTAERLERNLALSGLGRVEVLRYALGESEGTATIHVPEGHAGRASMAPEGERDATFTVAVRTLDSVWREQGRPAIGFVKADIEGSEPAMLRGAREMYATARPVTVMEINPTKLRRLGHSPEDVFGFFGSLGYEARRWDDGRTTFVPDDSTGEGDVLFVPRP